MTHVWSFILFLRIIIKNLLFLKIDIYLVYNLSKIWPTLYYYVDFKFSNLFENVKNSKRIFIFLWRLSDIGTNHPSIPQRGVSCSKVDLEESESSN